MDGAAWPWEEVGLSVYQSRASTVRGMLQRPHTLSHHGRQLIISRDSGIAARGAALQVPRHLAGGMITVLVVRDVQQFSCSIYLLQDPCLLLSVWVAPVGHGPCSLFILFPSFLYLVSWRFGTHGSSQVFFFTKGHLFVHPCWFDSFHIYLLQDPWLLLSV